MKKYCFKTVVFYRENLPLKNHGFKTIVFYKDFDMAHKGLIRELTGAPKGLLGAPRDLQEFQGSSQGLHGSSQGLQGGFRGISSGLIKLRGRIKNPTGGGPPITSPEGGLEESGGLSEGDPESPFKGLSEVFGRHFEGIYRPLKGL